MPRVTSPQRRLTVETTRESARLDSSEADARHELSRTGGGAVWRAGSVRNGARAAVRGRLLQNIADGFLGHVESLHTGVEERRADQGEHDPVPGIPPGPSEQRSTAEPVAIPLRDILISS